MCIARRGGADKAVVDGLAQTFARNRRDRDAGRLPRIELAQKTKKICRRLREIAAGRKIQHIFVLAKNPAEIEARLAVIERRRLKTKFCARCVMGSRHSRRTNWACPRGFRKRMAKHGFDVRPRDPAWPQHAGGFETFDDRRFKADRAAPAIEDQVDFAGGKIPRDVCGGDRAHPARAIGRRRRQWPSRRRNELPAQPDAPAPAAR